MRVLGVLDLAGGRAVHAKAGRRGSYAPVTSVGGSSIEPGDALAVATAYGTRLGISELYAADLDAIAIRSAEPRSDRPAAVGQDRIVAALAALGYPLWLDAGIASVSDAAGARALGAGHVVVGLETLPSYAALSAICVAVGGDAVAFSLDLRNGEPVVAPGFPPGHPPEAIAARAADAGARTIIVIDMGRVGTGAGVDVALIARLRGGVPGVMLLAGGGVRGVADLARLGDAGCDGALVATALQDGRVSAADIAAAQQRQPRAIR